MKSKNYRFPPSIVRDVNHKGMEKLWKLMFKLEKDHVPKYHKWMENEELREQTASDRLSLEEEFAMQQTWLLDENKCTFIILDKETMEGTNNELESMIGDANLYLNVSDDDEAAKLTGEIGLMVAEPQFRGRGLGKEIALCLMRYGIESIGILKFQAVISMKNEISIKMFEKLHFVKESASEVFKEVTLTRTVDEDFIRFVRKSTSVYQELSTRPNE
ncbi:hypothetical protein GE061_003487 [Apolygus lucorum]|uniref:N-acetyltransferase domain-containing protein n=1 Tax=Apolygus lucorum TaxID=248454 RepID=A0A8S9X3N7_APOLU|nr:hypothetical protein GE061_003487 [Apolygus lucorum]